MTAGAALLSFTPPVAAHSELTSSTPGANAVVTSAPSTVRATFSDRIEPKFSKATLAVAGGAPRAVPVTVDGETLRVSVPDGLRLTGAWKFAFRVVSVDGHPISGTIAFTVRPAAASTGRSPTPTPTASGSTTPPAAATTTATSPRASGHQDSDPLQPRRRLIYWVEGIVGAMLLLAAALYWARDRG
ncbi:copper resistance CopC family protein [Pedococcus dokdonensis]|uniref:copper resistance CopC family protein n=1 Tax=Pedococcus dokdonensis TaxID=443156 RepID=UPI000AA4BFCA|nr:copper resistance protein CopC [Pedococcus dokdonensis]